jgi:hypothetical protein
MLFTILPFFIQWLALSHYSRQQSESQQSFGWTSSLLGSQSRSVLPSFHPTKSHWSLLNDFQNLSENDLEKFLPQICNILVNGDNLNDNRVFQSFEDILVAKCSNCMPFGIRVCNLLKVVSFLSLLFASVTLSVSLPCVSVPVSISISALPSLWLYLCLCRFRFPSQCLDLKGGIIIISFVKCYRKHL